MNGAFKVPFSGFSDQARALVDDTFRQEILDGLEGSPKRLPCKYFYDERGASLFEAITALPEYYQTRTELRILVDQIDSITHALGDNVHLIEYGSGSSEKTLILLRNLPAVLSYVPIDISSHYLTLSGRRLAREFQKLRIFPLVADFTGPFRLPDPVARLAGRRVVFFPGSTIGNLNRGETVELLRRTAEMVGRGGALLIGVDLKKDKRRLEAAYNDASGVTAAFNLNLLARLNRELSARFRLDRFAHRAFFDEAAGRIEMHLESLEDQEVELCGRSIRLASGETIHTENSYKYSVEEFQDLARETGFSAVKLWTDQEALFSVHLLGVR